MRLLFPCHPLKARLPDPDYEDEVTVAKEAGFDCMFYDLEALRRGETDEAFSRCSLSEPPGERILHRGWMLTDTQYENLFEVMRNKGYQFLVSPRDYAESHYLPYAYPKIKGVTPITKWMEGKDLEEAWNLYQDFRKEPAIVKDYVKSAKHRWDEACFLPARTGKDMFKEIITAFLEARGSLFNKGIVLRRYHELVVLQRDIRGQPVHEEYRLFFWNGEFLAGTPALQGEGPLEQLEKWTSIAKQFANRFISMDIARQQDGTWIIVEVGDGGVSGLPPSIPTELFYEELGRRSSGN